MRLEYEAFKAEVERIAGIAKAEVRECFGETTLFADERMRPMSVWRVVIEYEGCRIQLEGSQAMVLRLLHKVTDRP